MATNIYLSVSVWNTCKQAVFAVCALSAADSLICKTGCLNVAISRAFQPAHEDRTRIRTRMPANWPATGIFFLVYLCCLHERLGALEQFIQSRFVEIARLARVDDRYLAILGGLDELGVGASAGDGNVGLLVAIVGEHLAVELDAFVAGRAARTFDVGLVGRAFRFGFDRRRGGRGDR